MAIVSSSSSSSKTSPFLAILLALISAVHSATYWEDARVLKQLKGTIDPSTVPPGSCIDSWDFNLDPCDNLFTDKFTCGFRCDEVVAGSARVSELALDAAAYSAPLSSVSWNLPYLRNLDLSNNNFTGPVPDSLSLLTRLQRLALSHNSLSGSIRGSTIGSLNALEELYLDSNALVGQIPSALNGLVNLKRLELQGNELGGTFPDLSGLTSLNFLDASNNAISGELPEGFPPSLIELVIRNNQIDGNIPSRVSGLGFLQVMDLSHNRLEGAVPGGLFAHPSLEQLTLSYNRFGWVEVPQDLGFSSQLISVDLSDNEIHGFLPGFMGLMPRLSALSLENNKFSGFIPTQYALKVSGMGPETAQLERLLLGGNYLFGPIPGSFLELKPDSATIRLGDNCLYRCPLRYFFCEGGVQKPLTECRAFGPIIP